eukprot:11220526-Lingulodinium_polyedra.AAC.1
MQERATAQEAPFAGVQHDVEEYKSRLDELRSESLQVARDFYGDSPGNLRAQVEEVRGALAALG